MPISAFIIGFLGSLHCAGMCGPIALALPLNTENPAARFLGILAYNSGRLLTYSIVGGLFGALGETLVLAGMQQWLSISIGIIILLVILLPKSIKQKFGQSHFMPKVVIHLKKQIGLKLSQTKTSSLFIIGLLNGLLPCGLVYFGIAGAIASEDSMAGAWYMAAFGLGTFPMMLSIPLLGYKIGFSVKTNLRKLTPLFIGTFALLFILRGMNLGIPYLSPKMNAEKPCVTECCHK